MVWQRWDEAWCSALYGPGGFYRRSEPAAHFATAAQGLGTTGRLLAEALVELAGRHGLSRIVEVAAGRGELLTQLADTLAEREHGSAVPRWSGHAPAVTELVGVDIVDRPAGLPSAVRWVRSPGGAALPGTLADLTDTLVVAHEWLDVVPCPVAARGADGTWRHVLVARSGAEAPGPPVEGAELGWLTRHLPDRVARAEIGLPRDTAYADLVSRVRTGAVLVIDYGHTARSRPETGTLTGYRDGTQVPPVPDGSCDLTAHVAMDSLGCDRLRSQREALLDLLGPVPLPPHALSRTDPAAYLRLLTRSNAAATLTASAGLGGFWWAMSHPGRGDLG